MKKIKLLSVLLFLISVHVFSQETGKDLVKTADELKKKTKELKKAKFAVSGTMGVTYEYYGLTTDPQGWAGYRPRKPYNQVRFNFRPTLSFGEFKLPITFNFAAMKTSVLGPYAGLKHQSLWEFVSNPTNNFGINPKYKWAELQLGTQYLNYSDLTTGDIGVFGAGFDLKPRGYILKFFTGSSQQGINYSLMPLIPGAYRRNNWMAQIGKEVEGKYKVALTAASGKDHFGSALPPPPSVAPQEGFVLSLLTNLYSEKGYFIEWETAQSYYSPNLNLGRTPVGGTASFRPFFNSNASSIADFAGTAYLGKKSKNFDIGFKTKYLGAGFYTTGYPMQQSDKLDMTLNTRFNFWKNKSKAFKSNVVASVGQRVNNYSNHAIKSDLLIANLNYFTQFSEQWSLNISYNNFGFQANSMLNPYNVKNVSNDFSVSPSFNWKRKTMSNLLTLNYSFSKYDERNVLTGVVTSNKANTAFLSYVPVFFNNPITPDFSLMYFVNQLPTFKTTLATFGAGAASPLFEKKVNLRAQLQYTFIKNNFNSPNNNVIGTLNIDWKITKQLTWTNFFSSNFYKYGNEALPVGANYLETNYKTGLLYNFNSKKK